MWRFPNFTRDEFACGCGCGFDEIDPLIVSTLQRLRDEVQRPVIVNSGCRCRSHNAAVKGSKSSQHLRGKAADIKIEGMTSREIFDTLRRLYLDGELYVGYVYAINGRSVHVDVRAPQSQVVRRWTR
ncbi:MAG: D-Ala-D-Ala carboxypeptidase family metallohydrolase [Bacilli bacterium]|jgi:uncharacterized protein YcbK (DUF882 family)